MAKQLNLCPRQPESKQTLPTTTSALLLMLLVVEHSGYALAKPNNIELLSTCQIGLTDSKHKSMSFALELMHSHHEDLSYVEPNITLSKRIEILARSSEERLHCLLDEIYGKDTTFGMEKDYTWEPKRFRNAFVVVLLIGTPPRKVPVELDTTTDLTWLHCHPCHKCFQIGPQKKPIKLQYIYDPQYSTTFSNIGCLEVLCRSDTAIKMFCSEEEPPKCVYNHKEIYGRASWKLNGHMAMEKFTFSNGQGKTTHELGFGCGDSNEGLFRGTTGVLGLGYGHLALLKQLDVSIFSYCFINFHSMKTKSSSLVFGSEHITALNYEIKYVQVLQGRTMARKPMYFVRLDAIWINGYLLDNIPQEAFRVKSDQIIKGGTLIDIGTTFSYFNSDIYNVLKTVIMDSLQPYRRIIPPKSFPLDLCYDIGEADNSVFPPVALEFYYKIFMLLPPENLFVTKLGKTGQYACLAIRENLNSKDDTLNIVGNFQLQNFRVIHKNEGDMDHKVGFIPAHNCNEYA